MPNKLKGYRVMAGYTQKDMAEKINMPLVTYVYKETGKGDFTLTEIKKIFKVLKGKINIKIDDLL